MIIAKFRNIQYGYINIEPVETWKDHEDFVQISEGVEVEFPEVSAEVTVPKEIEFHEKMKSTLHAAFLAESEKVDEKIKKLRAITHQPDEFDESD